MSSISVVETIVEFLRHEEAQVRCNACIALGAVEGAGAEQATRRLMDRALMDEDESVRSVARSTLAALPLPQRQTAVGHAIEQQPQGRPSRWLQQTLKRMGADALKGTPVSHGLASGLAWRLALKEGMPTHARDWWRVSIGGLFSVAVLAILLVFPLTSWVEISGALRLAGDAQSYWQIGAAAYSVALFWLHSRRQASLLHYLQPVQGMCVETVWTALVAAAVASMAVLLASYDAGALSQVGPRDPPSWYALVLAATMAIGLRWGSWAGLLIPSSGLDRRLRAVAGSFAAVGGSAAFAWLTLLVLPSGALAAGKAAACLPVIGVGTAAFGVAVAWRESQDDDSVRLPEQWRALSALVGVSGLVLLGSTMMYLDQHLRRMRMEATALIEPTLTNDRWSQEFTVWRLPFRAVVKMPKWAGQGEDRRSLILKLTTAAKSGKSSTYREWDPVLDVIELSGRERLKRFDDPESGCLEMGKAGVKVVLRPLEASASIIDRLERRARFGEIRPPASRDDDDLTVERLADLVPALVPRNVNDVEGPLATISLELADRSLLADDKVCKTESRRSGNYVPDATITTPLGVIQRGAKVVVRKPVSVSPLEGLSWNPEMDVLEGKELVVDTVDREAGRFRAKGERWAWDQSWVVRLVPAGAASSPAAAASR